METRTDRALARAEFLEQVANGSWAQADTNDLRGRLTEALGEGEASGVAAVARRTATLQAVVSGLKGVEPNRMTGEYPVGYVNVLVSWLESHGGGPDVQRALQLVAGDEDVYVLVRCAAAVGLGSIGCVRSAGFVLRDLAVDSETPGAMRLEAAVSLARFGQEGTARVVLLRLLDDPAAWYLTRADAARVASKLGLRPCIRERLNEMVCDNRETPQARVAAARVLRELGGAGDGTSRVLQEIAGDQTNSGRARVAAMRELAGTRVDDAGELLLDLIARGGREELGALDEAHCVLSELGLMDSAAAILAGRIHANRVHKEWWDTDLSYVIWELERMGRERDAQRGLEELISDDLTSSAVRGYAARELAALGAEAPAIDALIDVARDRHATRWDRGRSAVVLVGLGRGEGGQALLALAEDATELEWETPGDVLTALLNRPQDEGATLARVRKAVRNKHDRETVIELLVRVARADFYDDRAGELLSRVNSPRNLPFDPEEARVAFAEVAFDRTSRRRLPVIWTLERLGHVDIARAALLDFLETERWPYPREHAINALASLGADAGATLRALANDVETDPQDRLVAARALLEGGATTEGLTALADLVRNPNNPDWVRTAAVSYLTNAPVAGPDGFRELASVLAEPDLDRFGALYQGVATVLAAHGDPAGLSVLREIATAKDSPQRARIGAARELLRCGHRDSAVRAAGTVTDGGLDPDVFRTAIVILTAADALDEARSALVALAREPTVDGKYSLDPVDGLRRLGATPDLLLLSRDQVIPLRVRSACATAVSFLGGVDIARELAANPNLDSEVRLQAARAIAQTGPPELAVDVLTLLAMTPAVTPWIRLRAGMSLHELGINNLAVAALSDVLTAIETDDWVREAAAERLAGDRAPRYPGCRVTASGQGLPERAKCRARQSACAT